jgi:alpha-glucoside transport system substrate-binding protein
VRNRWVRGAVVTAFAAAVAVTAAGWSGHENGVAGTLKTTAVNASIKGTITFDGIWTSSSGQKQFQDVINTFNKTYPNVKVNYKPVGDSLPTVLATAVAGGHPPDMADIAQPGTVKQFATQGKLKPITYATSTINKNFAPAWRQLGTFNGKLYALVFKAANKSLVWYNVPAFKAAGVKPPVTWTQLLAAAKTIKASGTPAYSIGGSDGWTLTDMFENIYLRTFGPTKYEALSAHKI